MFFIPSSPTEFLKSEFYLSVKFKITPGAGGLLPAAVKVAPVENFPHMMWNDVSIHINNQLISGRNSLYAYSSFLDNLLFVSRESLS